MASGISSPRKGPSYCPDDDASEGTFFRQFEFDHQNAPVTNEIISFEDAEARSSLGKGKRLFLQIDPEGLFRHVWDIFFGAFVLAEALVVPVWVAYYADVNGCDLLKAEVTSSDDWTAHTLQSGWLALAFTSTYVYLMDILLNFWTGIPGDESGQVDYSFLNIARRYALQGWLLLDLLSVFPLQCIFSAAQPGYDWFNLGLMLSVLRLVSVATRNRAHLHRLSKWFIWFNFGYEQLLATGLLVFFAMHYFGCFAWFVVRVQDFPDAAPIRVWPVRLAISPPATTEVWQQYLWSYLSSVSVAILNTYGPFPPITLAEAGYWTVGILALAVVWALLNGQFTLVAFSERNSQYRYAEFVDQVKASMKQWGLPTALRLQILDSLAAKYQGYMIDEQRVEGELPERLLVEVKQSMYRHYLQRVPLLSGDEQLLDHLATCLKRVALTPGSFIVRQGQPLEAMYFIESGKVALSTSHTSLKLDEKLCTYSSRGEKSQCKADEILTSGRYFGEAALIGPPPPGQHDGRLKPFHAAPFSAWAVTRCHLLELGWEDVNAQLAYHEDIRKSIAACGTRYWKIYDSHFSKSGDQTIEPVRNDECEATIF